MTDWPAATMTDWPSASMTAEDGPFASRKPAVTANEVGLFGKSSFGLTALLQPTKLIARSPPSLSSQPLVVRPPPDPWTDGDAKVVAFFGGSGGGG